MNWGNISGSDVIQEAINLISEWDKDTVTDTLHRKNQWLFRIAGFEV